MEKPTQRIPPPYNHELAANNAVRGIKYASI